MAKKTYIVQAVNDPNDKYEVEADEVEFQETSGRTIFKLGGAIVANEINVKYRVKSGS